MTNFIKCKNCNNTIDDITGKTNCQHCAVRITNGNETAHAQVAGTVYGNVSAGSTIYGETKFNAERGHGFAAERANHLYDKLTGKDARIIGDDNKINGADRMVNGIQIQTKYCSSGSKCIQECFDKNGSWRYSNTDGTPMQIEVPSDKYDDAISALEDRIRKGKVPGVKDPAKAKEIVRKGHITYEQARNIARFGTVESLTYDAVNGMIVATTTFGITAAITFATSIWNGKDFDEALQDSLASGFKVFGITFVTSVLAGQLTKAGMYGVMYGASENLVRAMGPKAAATLVNALRSGTNIYGAAAMKSAQKMLGSNFVTGTASVAIITAFDVVNVFRGRISCAQLIKNVVNTTATVAGGTAGWAAGVGAGAAIGSVLGPVGSAVGGVIGGLFGAFAGGGVAGEVASGITGCFIEDDAKQMYAIIEEEFKKLAFDYLLNKAETDKAAGYLAEKLDGGTLKDMYASGDRHGFAKRQILPHVERVAKERKHVALPTQAQLMQGLKTSLEAA